MSLLDKHALKIGHLALAVSVLFLVLQVVAPRPPSWQVVCVQSGSEVHCHSERIRRSP